MLRAPDPQESMNAFYKLFYGPGAANVGRLYQLMSEQAQFWKESWDVKASAARTPIWGDWNIIYETPHPAEDQTLAQMPTPQLPLLTLPYDWDPQNSLRLKMAGEFLSENDELLDLIHLNLSHTQLQRYNLRVFLSIAQLFRENIQMLLDLQRISAQLKSAEMYAGRADAPKAVAALDQALNIAASIHTGRNEALEDATQTWYESWFARVSEANGRHFLNAVDNVKDHLPVRTVDLSYLIYRELLYPLGDWANGTVTVRNEYATAHHLSTRTFSWIGRTLDQRSQINKSVDAMRRNLKLEITVLCFQIITATSYAATSSPLFSRGYTVIPAPQKVSLGTKDFEFTQAWGVELGLGIKPDDSAVQSLNEQLRERFQLALGRFREFGEWCTWR